jgi:hypothetical protein
MVRLRQHRRLLGWLSATLLLGHVLAAALLAPSRAMTLVDDLLGTLVICTADGAKVVSHGDGPGGHFPADHSPANHCPACITAAQVALAAIIVLSLFAFPLLPVPALPLRHARVAAVRLSLGGIGSRAPPALRLSH